MILFVDTLGGVKYPEIISKLHKKYGTGYFWEEFGPAKAQITKDAQSGRSWIRVQGIWSRAHSFGSADESKAIRIGDELQRIALSNPQCSIYYSPYCEHRKDARYMETLLRKIQGRCPNLIIVNSPISGGQWVRGFVNEIHHNDKPGGMPQGYFIYSMDGLHSLDCDIEKHKKFKDSPNCIAWGDWTLQNNCKPNSKPENNIPPTQRKTKPTPELHTAMLFRIENIKQRVSLPKGWLYKAYAEQHHAVDPRANKPVVLTPKGKRFKKVTLGSEVLKESGTTDGRQVWRCGKWGYKIGRTLQIKADGRLIGTVDAAWRENEYREKT